MTLAEAIDARAEDAAAGREAFVVAEAKRRLEERAARRAAAEAEAVPRFWS